MAAIAVSFTKEKAREGACPSGLLGENGRLVGPRVLRPQGRQLLRETARRSCCFFLSVSKVKREAAAQRRPAQSERKNRVFSAKRQAVWFEMQSISN
ncbi:hypothetical protein QUW15_09590 [Desulfovibrio piger]|nr:hypothetical protein [Desulfovibrio piger]